MRVVSAVYFLIGAIEIFVFLLYVIQYRCLACCLTPQALLLLLVGWFSQCLISHPAICSNLSVRFQARRHSFFFFCTNEPLRFMFHRIVRLTQSTGDTGESWCLHRQVSSFHLGAGGVCCCASLSLLCGIAVKVNLWQSRFNLFSV